MQAKRARVATENLDIRRAGAGFVPENRQAVDAREARERRLREAAAQAVVADCSSGGGVHASRYIRVVTSRQATNVADRRRMPLGIPCSVRAMTQRKKARPRKQPPSETGARIVRLRTARGWTQEELADHAGVSRVTIARLETGARQQGTPDTLRSLAQALDVPLAALMEEESGTQSVKALVDEFRQSAWAATMRPPPSEDELRAILELGGDRALWTKVPATSEAIYHLIRAFRSEPNSTTD